MQQERTSSALIQAAQEAARQRIYEDQRGAPPDVVAILGAIARGLFEPGFSVAAARRACGATDTAVLHFQQRFVTTLQAYIKYRRLEVVKELVDDLRVDLGGVPRALGFKDADRCWRWFKKLTNQTPTQRREEISQGPGFDTCIRAVIGALRPEEAEELVVVCTESAKEPVK